MRRIGFGGKGDRKDSGPRTVHQRSTNDAHVQMRARATRGSLAMARVRRCRASSKRATGWKRRGRLLLIRNQSHGPPSGRLDGRRRERRGRHFAGETHVACISWCANAIRTSSRAMRCVFVSHAASAFRPAHLGPSLAPSSTATSHPRVRDAKRMWTPFRTCVASHATSRRRMVRLESHVYVRT